MTKNGMTPAQALRDDKSYKPMVGTLEAGKYADIVALPGNPLNDITRPNTRSL